MKRGYLVIIVVGAVVLITVLVLVLTSSKRFNWYETYEIKSREPYGAYIIGEMLKNYYPEKKFTVIDVSLKNALSSDEKKEHQNYIFIGSGLRYDSLNTRLLLEFVERGNTAFISVGSSAPYIFNSLFRDSCLYYYYYDDYYAEKDSSAALNFFNPSMKEEKDFKLTYVFQNRPFSYAWTYLDSSLFCGDRSNASALG